MHTTKTLDKCGDWTELYQTKSVATDSQQHMVYLIRKGLASGFEKLKVACQVKQLVPPAFGVPFPI